MLQLHLSDQQFYCLLSSVHLISEVWQYCLYVSNVCNVGCTFVNVFVSLQQGGSDSDKNDDHHATVVIANASDKFTLDQVSPHHWSRSVHPLNFKLHLFSDTCLLDWFKGLSSNPWMNELVVWVYRNKMNAFYFLHACGIVRYTLISRYITAW